MGVPAVLAARLKPLASSRAPFQFDTLTRVELEDRARKSLERRLGRSRLGRFKAMADFVYAWPKQIDREAVEAALRLGFLEKSHNVVLVANRGSARR